MLKSYEDLTIFLLIAPRSKGVVDKLTEMLKKDEVVAAVSNRIVFCSRSPYIIYQVRLALLSS